MKSKVASGAFILFAWGSLVQTGAQACPCVDKETLTINETYHEAGLAVDESVLPRLHNPYLILMVQSSIPDHQGKIKELEAISVNAGIPQKPSDLSAGFANRANAKMIQMKTLSGALLDKAYVDFRADELQRLGTAFDTYFITDVTTPTMKVWTKTERPRLLQQYNDTLKLQRAISTDIMAENL